MEGIEELEVEVDYEESENEYDEIEDDSITDDETSDYEPIDKTELEKNRYKDCNGCSKILTIDNSFKCKKCGIASHRSNCNTWFPHVKKHNYCGGCMYDFELTE